MLAILQSHSEAVVALEIALNGAAIVGASWIERSSHVVEIDLQQCPSMNAFNTQVVNVFYPKPWLSNFTSCAEPTAESCLELLTTVLQDQRFEQHPLIVYVDDANRIPAFALDLLVLFLHDFFNTFQRNALIMAIRIRFTSSKICRISTLDRCASLDCMSAAIATAALMDQSHGILLFVRGQWTGVVVDNMFPHFNATNEPAACQSIAISNVGHRSHAVMWPALFEKVSFFFFFA